MHDLNADSPIVSTVDGIVILVSDEQPSNVNFSIDEIFVGIKISLSDEHNLKLDSLRIVISFGILIVSNDEQK